MRLVKELSYTMNVNSVPTEKIEFEYTDIFQEFKKAVPFELR